MALITGNTYAVKEQLKSLGGRWDAAANGWRVPDAVASEAKALVGSAPRIPFAAPRRCCVCGSIGTRYSPIYRSGECNGCYEERKMGY